MKKRLIGFAALLLMLGVCLLPAFSVARAEENDASRLSFGDDGTFTVLILSDLQDTQFTTKLVVSGETHVLKDYPADTLFETIEKLHDTENRLANFEKALAADKLGRAKDCAPEIAFVKAHAADCSVALEALV